MILIIIFFPTRVLLKRHAVDINLLKKTLKKFTAALINKNLTETSTKSFVSIRIMRFRKWHESKHAGKI